MAAIEESNKKVVDNENYRKLSNYDNHTLFVTNIGPAEGVQINDVLVAFFSERREKLNIKDPNYFGSWKINVVKNKLDISIGLAYVFMIKEEAYNVAIGRNPDGTVRVKEIPNPDYKEQDDIFDMSSFMTFSTNMCWADMAETEVTKMLIVRDDTPIVKFPDIVLTPEQSAGLSINSVTPNIRHCAIADPEPIYDRYTLFASNIPSFVTPEYLRALFLPYVTNKRSVDAGFPQVTIIRNKAYVKFQSYNNDSLFALVMLKKIIFKDKNGHPTVVFFSYARDNRKM